MRISRHILSFTLAFGLFGAAFAQMDGLHEATATVASARAHFGGDVDDDHGNPPQLTLPPDPSPHVPTSAALPRMAPELALQLVQKHAEWQAVVLGAYSDNVEIDAELPDNHQQGAYELIRQYTKPDALSFTPVKFTGDGFVKTNVITRLLQQEVDHVKGDGSATALNQKNYKFNYKGTERLDGHDVHVFAVKPRQKVPGLFKGKIYVDVFTGTLRRAEGQVVKSPSFFIKKIEFVQDYDDVDGFNFPIKMHSTAMTRIVGRAIVNIFHRDYKAKSLAQTTPVQTSPATTTASNSAIQ